MGLQAQVGDELVEQWISLDNLVVCNQGSSHVYKDSLKSLMLSSLDLINTPSTIQSISRTPWSSVRIHVLNLDRTLSELATL